MGEIGLQGKLLSLMVVMVVAVLVLSSSVFVSNPWSLKQEDLSSNQQSGNADQGVDPIYTRKLLNFVRQETRKEMDSPAGEKEKMGGGEIGKRILRIVAPPGRLRNHYQHVWPGMKFGWRIVVGTVIGFFGAAFGSVGGVGGGGIFVPMLTLVIGFDAKSSTAISKCMITGAAAATVYYNIKLRHPTLDLPIIDYDLALLFQPMLVLGISIGVAFNVIFADWMITVLLIILFIGMSTKAFFKGVETWKKETITKKEAARRLAPTGIGSEEVENKPLPEGPDNGTQTEPNESKASKVSIIENVYWKELGILVAVWIIILSLQIAKVPICCTIVCLYGFFEAMFGSWIYAGNIQNKTATCSASNWVLNLLQIPVAFGASAYEAIRLYKGRRVIASRGEAGRIWRVHQLVLYCFGGIMAGVVGGMLGLGGGFILGPLFLELGVPPQVSSATATFAMLFSASLSVVEYHLLHRFPVPYSLYFAAAATVAAFAGQSVVRRIIAILGRASLIIFVLAFTIFVSAISLGGVGISNMIKQIEEKKYMGFDDICAY